MTTIKHLDWRGLRLSFFAFIAPLFLFSTCMSVEEDFLQSNLTIVDDNQTEFKKNGDSRIYAIESTRDWSVKVEAGSEWIAVSPMKGNKETKELTVTVKKNEGDKRKGSFVVTCSSIDKTITIIQEGKDAPSPNYVSIKDLRDMYADSGKSELIINESLLLKAVVISDREGANRSAKRDGYIQDATGYGLAYRVTQSETPYDMGDELIINLQDAKLHYFDYAGILQLVFSKMDAEIKAQNISLSPKELTIKEIENNRYDGTLVKVKNVQFKEYKGLNFYSGEGNATSRMLESIDGNVMNVKTTKNASFKNEPLPAGMGNIVAIVSYCKKKWELQLRNLDDVKEMSSDESTRFEQKDPPAEATKITIADLRAKLKNEVMLEDEIYIKGEVILNAFKGNVTDDMVYIADETAGISLLFSDNKNVLTNVPIGAEVKVELQGVKAIDNNGLLQIGDDNTLSTQAVTIIEEEPATPLQPKVVTIGELLTGNYLSELVRIDGVQFKELGKTYATNSSIINRAGEAIDICTKDEADFAYEVVKEGMGAFVGVVSVDKTPQLIIRTIDDLAAMTGHRFDVASSYIMPNKSEVAFEGYGGVEDVIISANVDWQALSNGGWLSISPISGSNDGAITVTADRNGDEARSATILITNGEIVETIEVTQKSASESSETAEDLFISEYVMGSSYNKYLEIFNGTGEEVDLTDYKIELYVNGQTNASRTQTLEGILKNGEVIVVQHPKASLYGGETYQSNALNFNGNDAIALLKVSSGDYVDIFGRIGEDPITEWIPSLNFDLSTKNRTLVRKQNVRGGVTKNPKKGFPTLAYEWVGYPKDTVDNLGWHTMD